MNKYLNKIEKDFNNLKWDDRLRNYDNSHFPTLISNKIEIKPKNDNSEVFIIFNQNKANKQVQRNKSLDDSWLLSKEIKMVFILYLNYKLSSCTPSSAKRMSQRALSVATLTNYHPHEYTQDRYSQCIEKSKVNINRFNEFVNWCVSHQYCEPIRTQKVSEGGVYDGATRNKKKLPDTSSIIALGDIFCQTIPQNNDLWDTSVNSNQSNALASLYSALCLSAPNRMCAEIITLPKQKLLKAPSTNEDGELVILHSLMWQGSKHYKDNENHIGAWMAEQVERGIDYFNLVTQPYRILAKFWINQESTIKELFQNLDTSVISRLETANLTENDTPSLFQLGYLLGFYGSRDNFELKKNQKDKGKSNYHISQLTPSFKIYCQQESAVGELIGYSRLNMNSPILKYIPLNQSYSIKEIQNAIYQAMTADWPSFPNLSMGESSNKTNIQYAMWCLNGVSIGGDGGFYQLVSARVISNLIKRKFTHAGLLKDFNYSERLKITPHQLRHYINHNGYINGMPDYILNMWSGRQDTKHLLYYIHEENEDKLARIPMLTEQVKVDNISVSTEEEFAQARGLVPGATNRTSVGFCIKDLRYSPCSYLSRFETQCTFCEHSCHIAHDENGIRVLKEDYQIQCERLNTHHSSPRKNNENAKKWYKMHKANVYLLEQLIETLEDKSIDAGSVVRVIIDVQQIRIADLKTKTITNKKFRLDEMEQDIQEGLKLLDYSQEKSQRDIEMESFLDELWGDL